MSGSSQSSSLLLVWRGAYRFVKRWSNWLLAIVIIAVIVMQWPLIRGMLYPALGIEPASSSIDWRTDYEAAQRKAAATGRLVLLDFTAGWCPPCRAMKYGVWPDDRVEALVHEHFVPVTVDVDQSRYAALMRTYDVRMIPTIVIVDWSGRVLARGHYMSAEAMVEFLEPYAHSE